MSRSVEERKRRLAELLAKLRDRSQSGVPILVEGRKDAEALASIGVFGKIISVKSSGHSLLDQLDELKTLKEAIILTDFDRRGAQLAKLLSRSLTENRVKVDMAIWKETRALVKHEIKDIEGLPALLEHMEAKLD